MCGIAGFVDRRIALADAADVLGAMTDALAHRGPDGEGSCVRAASGRVVALGHRRLAIIDLEGGVQPVVDASTDVALTYNGELYNFLELRRELEGRGHKFRTNSDTEVVLRAYLEWGTRAFARFRGMFALAIWDPRSETLILARDHFGKKPIFYRSHADGLDFASEPKALLTRADWDADLDRQSVAELLAWRYVPGPNTLFQGMRKLRPGSYAVFNGQTLTETQYYLPPYASAKDGQAPEISDPVAAFRESLEEAVRVRMVSDVPFGAFLSGGLDSSAIVALMARVADAPVKTFAVGFREAENSELPYARMVADRFGTDHTELVVSATDLMDHLPHLVGMSDGPVAEPSNIPIWMISRKASESVKMVLTGEGSDELLAGYPKHLAERYGRIWRTLVPGWAQDGIVNPILSRTPYRYRKLKTFAASVGLRSDIERLSRWMGAMTFDESVRLLREPVVRRPVDLPSPGARSGRSDLERALLFDQTSWLPDNLLERGDRMTMAASIEARMPFMDSELASLVSRLGDKWRVRGLTTKYVLRRAMKDVLPSAILSRPKVGFRVPVDAWFRGPMRAYLNDHLRSTDALSRDLLDPRAVDQLVDDHVQGRRNHEKLLWSLLNFELFLRHTRDLRATARSRRIEAEPARVGAR